LLGIVAAIERARQRNVAAGGLGALVAWAVLLVDPWALTDLGAWLSVSALWGATAAARWSERVLGRSAAWSIVANSIGATVATAPLSALVFGSISLVGVALNLIAIPLTSFALPAVLMSLLVAPLSTAASEALAAGGGLLLHLLEILAERGGGAPGAALAFEPGPIPAVGAMTAIGATVWLFGRRNRLAEVGRRLAWLAAAVGAISAPISWLGAVHSGPGLTLHFLEVGQGDAALIRTGAGHWILIDAGPRDERGDAGRRVIAPFLLRHGVRRLAAVILSHAHRDHYGGLSAVLDEVAVDRVFEPALAVPDRDYLALLDQLEDRAIPWQPLRAGDRLEVDEATLAVVHPDTGWVGWGEDLNENSVVLRLRVGRFDALLGGDAGLPVEARITSAIGEVDLLKVGHHGSRTATGTGWLAGLRPSAAVISVGANRYGHPSPEAVARLAAAGAAVWRTDRDGTVTVRVDSASMRITSRRGDTLVSLRP
jgi:competence protein ComEC